MTTAGRSPRTPDAPLRRVELRAAVYRLAGVLRMARIHAPENRAMVEAAEELAGRLRQLVSELGGLVLRVDASVVRVNGVVLASLGPASLKELNALAADLEGRGLGGIRIVSPPGATELLSFIETWRSAPAALGAERFNATLVSLGVDVLGVVPPKVQVEPAVADSADDESVDRAVRAYCALLSVGELLSSPATVGLSATVGRAEAALHLAADVVATAPRALLCAATHRDPHRYGAVHGANIAALSMLLARAVGLGLDGILDAGRGALFCDVGMPLAASGVREHPGELDRAWVRKVVTHPVESFAVGLSAAELEAADRARLVVAWEHHLGVDGEGYPGAAPGRSPHLYSRICAVVDGYDALVHERGDRPGLPRPLALEVLDEESGRRLDARLLREFFVLTGRFPPGSVVRLQEGWVAMAATPASDPRMFDRPDIVVIRDPRGRPVRPRLLRLSELIGERSTRIAQVLDDRLFSERLVPLMLEL